VIVFVALDGEGRPTTVPAWTPASELDCALEAYALRLGELRRQMDGEMEHRLGTLAESFQRATSRG
jgi:hypothetical protein